MVLRKKKQKQEEVMEPTGVIDTEDDVDIVKFQEEYDSFRDSTPIYTPEAFGGSNFKAEVLNLLFAILREVKKK